MKRLFFVLAISLTLIAFQSDRGISFMAVGTEITTDMLGNIYVYDSTTLTTYNPLGKYLARYSAMYEHRISHVDATNPFKIIVFDKDDQTLIYLDNTLNPVQQANSLTELGLGYVIGVCSSSDNGFWVYDEFYGKLRHFDKFLNEVTSSAPITRIESSNSAWMQESGDWVLLYFPSAGLLICDKYGNEIHFVNMPNLKSPCYESGFFHGISGSILTSVNLQTQQVSRENLESDFIKAISFDRGQMILLFDEKVTKTSWGKTTH